MNINTQRRRKITQRQAARVLRVSHEHLNRVIHGKHKNAALLSLYHDLLAQNQPATPEIK